MFSMFKQIGLLLVWDAGLVELNGEGEIMDVCVALKGPVKCG
jgi:hypothetical protein